MITFRPLPQWPHQSTAGHLRRSRYTFKAGWSNTMGLLERELGYLDAANVIIGIGFDEWELRRDGYPRADARAHHPGVELSFDSTHGRLTYATDVCDIWQHNVRSIALGLESLRAVDRYGITRRGEQYAGWRELPSGIQMVRPMTLDEAHELIGGYGGITEALKATHPDRGGDPDDFQRVQEARRLLERAS